MRIVILHRYPANQVGGTNASFITFLEELKKKKHQVLYLTYKDPGGENKIPGVGYRELPFYFNRGNPKDKLLKTFLWIFLAPLKTLEIKIKDKPDLFYADDSVPYYGFFSKLLVGKTKVVIRLGDLQSGYNFADQGFFKGILFKLSLLVEKIMWKKVDGLVAISQPFAEFLKKQGIESEKIKLVEESIDLEKFAPGKSTQDLLAFEGQPLIAFHGALLPCKGLETFIRAANLVLKKIPQASFLIAGGGSEEKKLKKMAQPLIGKKKIFFTGWYNHHHLPHFLKKIDIGVVMRSANMANNFVLTTCLLEYWAAQKPVIVPNLAALRGVVKEGFNGLFFTPDSEEDLAEKIIYLIRNKSLWRVLGDNGWQTAKKYFAKKLIARKMVKVLEEFI